MSDAKWNKIESYLKIIAENVMKNNHPREVEPGSSLPDTVEHSSRKSTPSLQSPALKIINPEVEHSSPVENFSESHGEIEHSSSDEDMRAVAIKLKAFKQKRKSSDLEPSSEDDTRQKVKKYLKPLAK